MNMSEIKTKVNAFNRFATTMSVWEKMQESGIDHIKSPCDIRRIAMKNIAREWRDLLNKYPEFLDLLIEKRYFEMLFKSNKSQSISA